jgi:very-short-patch-repair endonuclease
MRSAPRRQSRWPRRRRRYWRVARARFSATAPPRRYGNSALPLGSIDVTTPGRQTGRPAGVRVHRTSHLDARDVRILQHLPVTSPLRTVLDIAEELADRDLERAVDEALVQRLVREGELERAASEANGRHGAARLRELLRDHDAPAMTWSKAEQAFLALVRDAQLPEPQVNVRVNGYRVDFYWRRHGLVVEVDGYKFHRTRSKFESDRRKDARLGAAGLRVIRITWRQIEREPLAAIARLAQALAWEEFRRRGG